MSGRNPNILLTPLKVPAGVQGRHARSVTPHPSRTLLRSPVSHGQPVPATEAPKGCYECNHSSWPNNPLPVVECRTERTRVYVEESGMRPHGVCAITGQRELTKIRSQPAVRLGEGEQLGRPVDGDTMIAGLG